MSGHSKWSTIKRKKEKTDSKRGKIFTKIGRELAVAVKEGGPDPDLNSRLRDVIAKAKANNMPQDSIMRSIKKAAGESGNVIFEEILYEGYAPGGVAVIAEVVTDNRNRTAAEIRHIFDKNGGTLGTNGSVSYMFDFKGLLLVERSPGVDEDELMLSALDAGAEDVKSGEEGFEIYTAPNDFSAVREALETSGYSFLSAERQRIAQTSVVVEDEENLAKTVKLLEMLEDSDDVMNVYHNAELPEEPEEE